MRHQIDQRKQKDKFTHNGYNHRAKCTADRNESHLTGNLDSKEEKAATIYAQSFCGKGSQSSIRSENSGKKSREALQDHPERNRVSQRDTKQKFERFFDTIDIF